MCKITQIFQQRLNSSSEFTSAWPAWCRLASTVFVLCAKTAMSERELLEFTQALAMRVDSGGWRVDTLVDLTSACLYFAEKGGPHAETLRQIAQTQLEPAVCRVMARH